MYVKYNLEFLSTFNWATQLELTNYSVQFLQKGWSENDFISRSLKSLYLEPI